VRICTIYTVIAILPVLAALVVIAIGASPPDPAHPFTLGSLQDEIINHAEADVLVTHDS
jgi:nucleotide-binding universal stress UspA family protein